MNPKIEQRNPNDLRPHALNERMPRPAKDSPKWYAILDDVTRHGIKLPISITARNEVVDGETRRQAAISLNLPAVPCVVIGDDEVADTMIRGMEFRRNLTASQRAYLCTPLIQEALEESRRRRIAGLRRGNEEPEDVVTRPRENIGSFEDLARSKGISVDVLRQARRVAEAFAENPELRVQFEPQILREDGPISLGAALAGIASIRDVGKGNHGGGPPKDIKRQVELFSEAFSREARNRIKHWDAWDESWRREAFVGVTTFIESSPRDFLKTLRGRIDTYLRKPEE